MTNWMWHSKALTMVALWTSVVEHETTNPRDLN